MRLRRLRNHGTWRECRGRFEYLCVYTAGRHCPSQLFVTRSWGARAEWSTLTSFYTPPDVQARAGLVTRTLRTRRPGFNGRSPFTSTVRVQRRRSLFGFNPSGGRTEAVHKDSMAILPKDLMQRKQDKISNRASQGRLARSNSQ